MAETTSINAANSALSHPSILVIDDNPDMLMLNQLILEMDGFVVRTAANGPAALAFLAGPIQPDLILLDMCMEGMSGPEFLVALEQERPKTFAAVPVVYLTAMQRVPEGKHSGFLRKGTDNSQFVEAVHHFLAAGPRHCDGDTAGNGGSRPGICRDS